MNLLPLIGQRPLATLPYVSQWCGYPTQSSGELMGRQLQRLEKMIATYALHYKTQPGAIVAGGQELRDLMKEVGGQPIVLFEIPLYLVDQDVMGVIADPKELERSRFTYKEKP